MPRRTIITLCMSALIASNAFAEIVKHTTVTVNDSGTPTSHTEIVTDDQGNLRIEDYGITSTASSSGAAGSSVSQEHFRGSLQNLMIFQAAEQRMLLVEGDRCRAMSSDSGVPGMPTGGMGQYQQQMQQAQGQMAQVMRQMAEQNPEMAKILEQQMAGPGNMASMMQPPKELVIEELGQNDPSANTIPSGLSCARPAAVPSTIRSGRQTLMMSNAAPLSATR